MHKSTTAIVIPNWNGLDTLGCCLASLEHTKAMVVVVDNGSVDGSVDFIKTNYPLVELIALPKNIGFAGGVNKGVLKVIDLGFEYVALFNNDAVATEAWLEHLVVKMRDNSSVGIATCKLINASSARLDSTGEAYTTWGLPYPRGRGEPISQRYDSSQTIFGASGGASLYRISMLKEIGLFDEDFFAYYEDIDLSFRAQLAGWKVWYEPRSIVYHDTGSTSRKIKGFTTYQTIKNLPWLLWKNVPARLLLKIWPRFFVAHLFFVFAALQRRQLWPVTKGLFIACLLFPKKLLERHKIQSTRKVSVEYIESIITFDLPPNATRLRKFRKLLRLKY